MTTGTPHLFIYLLTLFNGFRSGGRRGTGINRFFGFLGFEPAGKIFDVLHDGKGLVVGQGRFPGRHGGSLDALADGFKNVGVEREGTGRGGPVFEHAFAKIARPRVQVIDCLAAAVAILTVAERAHVFVYGGADGFTGLRSVAFMTVGVVGVCIQHTAIRSYEPKDKGGDQKTRQEKMSNGPVFGVSIRCIRFHYHSNHLRQHRSRYSCNCAGSRLPCSKTGDTSR